jgi:hypothetical protein
LNWTNARSARDPRRTPSGAARSFDEVAVYNQVLSAQDVAAHHAA